ncbi:hypothetical protein CEUSTIGMA_g10206.t1 [Chlamydomonas eustigma]|uniref:EF-hand domain-containing protein n=1 Tax=Chlamydomonas eustigma TaxID=1157962 RepID=A0A250XJ08_9CHLO|nr:hypothetical protein CEUSTIGMA_g10206.t1 [Chlamydomonas eustigma]|eukprot:GAX82780.1 hypothetical protein CEUSTIGMA_g10206.t1 [Chlamydomonas eustigma]
MNVTSSIPSSSHFLSLPPGIAISPVPPRSDFKPYNSPSVSPSTAPYQRLVVISSRVYQPMKVALSVLPRVGVVVYDWSQTLNEILVSIDRILGSSSSKVTSIALVAPGHKPGSVSLVDGVTATVARLRQDPQLLQFWRRLSGMVRANDFNDGRRIDLIGCRVAEAPAEGAALLRELWIQTAVPFTAADDALRGYLLSTFVEDPLSGSISLISSRVPGLDLYFNRDKLFKDADRSGVHIMVHQLGEHPAQFESVIRNTLPGFRHQSQGGERTVLSSQQQDDSENQQRSSAAMIVTSDGSSGMSRPAAALNATVNEATSIERDVFRQFVSRLGELGLSVDTLFQKYDTGHTGQLSNIQVEGLLREVLPGATKLDVQHFLVMVDADKDNLISLQELKSAVDQGVSVYNQVKKGADEHVLLLQRLHDYLTDNEGIIQEYFRLSDEDESGLLDHMEVAQFVQSIPGLNVEERKYIIGYLYQSDKNNDGNLSVSEFMAVVAASFGQVKAKVTIAHTTQ